MKPSSQRTYLFIIFALTCASAAALAPQVRADSAAQINRDARSALQDFYAINPKAEAIGARAAVLVFPSVKKGGFVVAAHHGEGALMSAGRTIGYYRTVAVSYGFQAGIQKFGYALFFMNQQSMAHLHDQSGWELGSAPSLVVVNKGVSSVDLARWRLATN